jgi:hypothetical protein
VRTTFTGHVAQYSDLSSLLEADGKRVPFAPNHSTAASSSSFASLLLRESSTSSVLSAASTPAVLQSPGNNRYHTGCYVTSRSRGFKRWNCCMVRDKHSLGCKTGQTVKHHPGRREISPLESPLRRYAYGKIVIVCRLIF